MNGTNIVADTSLLINFFNGSDTAKRFIAERNIFVSGITEIELLSFPGLSQESKMIIKSFLAECVVIDLETEIKDIAVKIRSKFKLKLPDAVIAATSIRYDFPLFTMDYDFKKVDELKSVIIEL